MPGSLIPSVSNGFIALNYGIGTLITNIYYICAAQLTCADNPLFILGLQATQSLWSTLPITNLSADHSDTVPVSAHFSFDQFQVRIMVYSAFGSFSFFGPLGTRDNCIDLQHFNGNSHYILFCHLSFDLAGVLSDELVAYSRQKSERITDKKSKVIRDKALRKD